MAEPAELYHLVVREIVGGSPATASKMFGMPCLKVAGKAFAGLNGSGMVFKLGGDAHARALALPGAHLFEPMQGRPMREWVEVPAASAPAWAELGWDALGHVGGARR
jgi:hypothetical protein